MKVASNCKNCGVARLLIPSRAKIDKGYCKKCMPVYFATITETRKRREQVKAVTGLAKCASCQKDFEVRINQARKRKFCSQDCSRKFNLTLLNQQLTDEARKKAIEKRSAGEKWKSYVESNSGANNYNWKGGLRGENYRIRRSAEYRNWRTSVFKRDDYTCQMCKTRGGRFEADHIKPFAYFPELRFEVSNGRTLCVDCHKQTDTYGHKVHKVLERMKTAFEGIEIKKL